MRSMMPPEGEPPVSAGVTPRGWYPHPRYPGRWRHWDGKRWSARTRPYRRWLPETVDVGRRGGLAALVGSSLGYGAVLALIVSAGVRGLVAWHVLHLTLWIGPVSAFILGYAMLATRRAAPCPERRLAQAGLLTVLVGPFLWLWVQAPLGF